MQEVLKQLSQQSKNPEQSSGTQQNRMQDVIIQELKTKIKALEVKSKLSSRVTAATLLDFFG